MYMALLESVLHWSERFCVGNVDYELFPTPLKCSLLVDEMRFSRSQHFLRSNELTRTRAALDFSTKYAASSTGKAGVMGTAAAPSAKTANMATVYS